MWQWDDPGDDLGDDLGDDPGDDPSDDLGYHPGDDPGDDSGDDPSHDPGRPNGGALVKHSVNLTYKQMFFSSILFLHFKLCVFKNHEAGCQTHWTRLHFHTNYFQTAKIDGVFFFCLLVIGNLCVCVCARVWCWEAWCCHVLSCVFFN